MKKHITKIGNIMEYSNKSYAYWSDLKKCWINIPTELAKKLITLKQRT